MDTESKAMVALKNGGIVIFPTDTAYALGCRADSESAVSRLFTVRKRPKNKAVPVLVSDMEMAKKLWATPLPNIVRHLVTKYWPGALTIVYTAQSSATPLLLRGGTDSIGLRMPNHPVAQKLIAETGVGLVGTSANFPGSDTPYSFESLDPNLVKRVDYVLERKCGGNMSSTVVDCISSPPKILRKGAVDAEV